MARDAGNRRFLGRLSVKGPSVEWGAALIVGIGIGVSLFGAHFIRDAVMRNRSRTIIFRAVAKRFWWSTTKRI